MKQTSGPARKPAEAVIKDIRRATRRQFSAEEKIRIVLDGLRGEDSIAELCRREGIASSMYYGWSKEFLEAGKKRLAGDTARAATADEVQDLRREAGALKEVVADLVLENRLLKKTRTAKLAVGLAVRGRRGRRRDRGGSGCVQCGRVVRSREICATPATSSDRPGRGRVRMVSQPARGCRRRAVQHPAARRRARPSCARWHAARGSAASRTAAPGHYWSAAGRAGRRHGTTPAGSCAPPCGSGRGRLQGRRHGGGDAASMPRDPRSAAGPWLLSPRQDWPADARQHARRRSPAPPQARAVPCRRARARSRT